jgi:GTP cyclohydrolase II
LFSGSAKSSSDNVAFLLRPTISLNWGHKDPTLRGPVIATVKHGGQRNAIGAHGGGYCIYTALAVAAGELDTNHIPNLNTTAPTDLMDPQPSWVDPKRLVTIDPWGHMITDVFEPYLKKGYDIRPTIAVTKAHIDLVEIRDAIAAGRLVPDGDVLTHDGQCNVTKCAIEPVWYLPGIAERFGVSEMKLRETIFRETNMMYPELLTRHDIKVFLPPIGGLTIYIWGDPLTIPDENVPLTVRVHDECNGSDVFASDICTCRPYLAHAIEECIRCAQNGGAGICIYYRKEGRSLGEVTKYLVYNMRKRAEGGDQASEYFNCTKNVAGITDTRFQAMMPDALQWLGVTKIDRFISMSDMKYDAIVATGIKIVERVPIPPELVPKDAQVEIQAKVFVGYHGGDTYAIPSADDLKDVKGRETSEHGSGNVGGGADDNIDPKTGKQKKK